MTTPVVKPGGLSRRQILLIVLALVVSTVLGIGVSRAVQYFTQDEPQQNAAAAAELDCKTTTKELKLGLMTVTAYKLPDVGAPKGIVVVPSCFKNTQVPTDDLSYYIKDVDVYVMLSHDQLTKLFMADGYDYGVENNVPYGVEGPALNHLVSPELQRQIDTDPSHVSVTYMVTSGPMPTKQVGSEHGDSYLISPFDALTGVHYGEIPFTTRHPLYDAGDPIVINGSK